jgi:hypothetical protein
MPEDLEENAGIGQEIFRRYFHKCIYFGNTVLYDDFGISPSDSSQDTITHQHEFNQAVCHTEQLNLQVPCIRENSENPLELIPGLEAGTYCKDLQCSHKSPSSNFIMHGWAPS